jgi:ABC-type glycerol-3-phosphate transport system substrate-binding protein
MKKKVLSLLLVAAMGMSMLVGCGGGETNTGNTETPSGDAGTTTEVTDVKLTVWCPQNQIDTGLMADAQAAFAAEHPEWTLHGKQQQLVKT